MERFDWVRFVKEMIWVLLAGVAGVGVVVASNPSVLEDLGSGRVGMPVLLMLGYGAIRAAIGWGKTHWPADSWLRRLLVVLFCLGLSLGASGCAGFGGTGLWRPAVGDHSQANVLFEERLADGSVTKVQFRASGEAANSAAVEYRGEAAGDVTPWSLSVRGDGHVTSPQAQSVADGYAAALEAMPGTLEGLAAQLMSIAGVGPSGEDGDAAPGLRQMLMKVAIERFMARLRGPGEN